MSLWHLYIPLVLLLSAATIDRFIHFVWAAIFFLLTLLMFAGLRTVKGNKSILIRYWSKASTPVGISRSAGMAMSLFVLYLGSWIPDTDWLVHSHRNPITHSILPLVLMAYVVKTWNFGNREWNELLLIMFGYGLGSHLLTDIIPGGNVVWLPAYIDMPFLVINGVACIVLSHRTIIKRMNLSPEFKKSMQLTTTQGAD